MTPLLLTLLSMPPLYLIIWGLKNGKPSDWLQSIHKTYEDIKKSINRFMKRVIHEQERKKRSTKIMEMR